MEGQGHGRSRANIILDGGLALSCFHHLLRRKEIMLVSQKETTRKPKSNKYLVSVLLANPPASFKTEMLGETSLDWIFDKTEAAQIIVTRKA
jgi:hypothetical protein